MSNKIKRSSWERTVYFDYKKLNGETERYKADVYDFNDEKFYGWDHASGHIKSFFLKEAKRVKVGKKFEPKFERKTTPAPTEAKT